MGQNATNISSKIVGGLKWLGNDIKDIGYTLQLENKSFIFDLGLWTADEKILCQRNWFFGD